MESRETPATSDRRSDDATAIPLADFYEDGRENRKFHNQETIDIRPAHSLLPERHAPRSSNRTFNSESECCTAPGNLQPCALYRIGPRLSFGRRPDPSSRL